MFFVVNMFWALLSAHFSLSRAQNIFTPVNINYIVILIEDITRWREDMNFMFEWREQYLTSERSERVKYCSCHENIKFISSS